VSISKEEPYKSHIHLVDTSYTQHQGKLLSGSNELLANPYTVPSTRDETFLGVPIHLVQTTCEHIKDCHRNQTQSIVREVSVYILP
jgi:hypothetical protein